MPVTLLRLDSVTKRYRDGARHITVLDGVSLQIATGETIGLAGQRRSGKTTLLRIAAGIELADEGVATFDGVEMRDCIDERARLWRRGGVALVSGDWRPPPGRQTIEEVSTPLLAGGATASEAERTALQTLERVEIASLAGTPLERLSIGERIRVDLARALVREPRLLLVDEPAVLPGPSEARALQSLLRRLPGELGLALVIASEDLSAVSGLPRLINIADGRIASTAPPSDAEVIPFPDGGRRGRSEAS